MARARAIRSITATDAQWAAAARLTKRFGFYGRAELICALIDALDVAAGPDDEAVMSFTVSARTRPAVAST